MGVGNMSMVKMKPSGCETDFKIVNIVFKVKSWKKTGIKNPKWG